MKICFVTTSSASITAFILPMAKSLADCGFTVSFVTTCEKGFYEKCPNFVKVHDFSVKRGFDVFGTLKAAIKFKNLCKQEKYDIVAYATPNGALYGSLGAWFAKVPCRVLLQWGMRYVGFHGLKRRIVRNIEKISCRLATDIRNVSEKNRKLAISDKMYKPEKCKVLGLGGTIGVDLESYDLSRKKNYINEVREKYKLPKDSLVYGFVGRICKDKGIQELCLAFENVQKIVPDSYLFLVGKIDENAGLSNDILTRIHENEHIICCGAVPVEEVCKYMSAFDVLVHPTYREGFGMVLQEAAAMEIPTITNDIPGASEAIVDGETGLLAKVGDVDSLTKTMIKMFDVEIRMNFGKNGRKRIENYFERSLMIQRICDDYIELYKKRCKGKK